MAFDWPWQPRRQVQVHKAQCKGEKRGEKEERKGLFVSFSLNFLIFLTLIAGWVRYDRRVRRVARHPHEHRPLQSPIWRRLIIKLFDYL